MNQDPATEGYTPQQLRRLAGLRSSVRTRVALPGQGHLVTMGFPGLVRDARGHRYVAPEQLRDSLSHPALDDCALLLVFPEAEELPVNAVQALQAACAARGIEIAHLPIVDYQVPSGDFVSRWARVSARVDAILAGGGTLGLCCHHGAGRSGMMAAALLVDHGVAPAQAVRLLRAQFPPSVETEAQMAWVAARAPQDRQG